VRVVPNLYPALDPASAAPERDAEPDLFTAVAVNAGALMTSTCKPSRPLPFLIIQGKKDPRMPWAGGTFDGTYRLPVVDLVKRIASRNQCSSTSDQVSYSGGPAECRTVTGCGANEVTYCGVEGVGHQWIGGPTILPMLLGGNTDKFNTTFAMWRFFSRHPAN
jgi:polyhydroxybutyrate depolymerase